MAELLGGICDQFAGNSLDGLFACRVHVGDDQDIRKKEGLAELFVKIPRPGIEMRLKHADESPAPAGLRPCEGYLALGGMMGIVVVDCDPFRLTAFFPPAVHAGELFDTGLYLFKRDTEFKPDGDGGKGILDVMVPRYLDHDITEIRSILRDGKVDVIILRTNIPRLEVGLRVQSIGNDFFLTQLRHNILKCGFIQAKHNKTIKRHLICELNECILDILEVAVAIEVVCFKGSEDSNRRRNGLFLLSAYTEFLGGLFVLLGFLTRISSAGLVINMAVAVLHVHLLKGLFSTNGGFEYPLTLLVVSLCIFLMGPGKLSIYNLIFNKNEKAKS